jgi:Fe-S cluster assembly protein SufD
MSLPANELATELKAQALAQANARAENDDALRALRERARALLEKTGFPGPKNERWKYTSLRALEAGHLKAPANQDLKVELPEALGFARVVFVNGRFDADLSTLPEIGGLELIRLNGEQEASISEAPASPFAWLNGAALSDGLLLRVAPGQRIEQPIHVLHVGEAGEPASCHMRLRLEAGEQSEVTLVEEYAGNGPILTNTVTEIEAAPASRVQHYRLQHEAVASLHIGSLILNLAKDSAVRSDQFMSGTTLRRNEVQAQLNAPGADLELNGAFIGRGKTHTDNQICVEHRAPHCTSRQVFKGMAGDSARLVFNGRIYIARGAKGTSADLSNQNLLLSTGAEIDTKPELEIYNDDVLCSHGTTVGQMDALQLFYLRSRGISEETAQRMLGIGFINELLLGLPHEAIADLARPWLASEVTEAE